MYKTYLISTFLSESVAIHRKTAESVIHYDKVRGNILCPVSLHV